MVDVIAVRNVALIWTVVVETDENDGVGKPE